MMKQSSAKMRDEQPERDRPEGDEAPPSPISQDPSEAKRLEARRRFLLGGGIALTALVTVSPGRVGAITVSECAERFPNESKFIVDANRFFGRGGSDQALLNCLQG